MPSGTDFDRGFNVELTRLVGGRPIVGDVAVVSDSMAFLRVWHEEDVEEEITPENFFDVYTATRGFRWWSWKIGSDAAREIPGQTPQGGFANKIEVDGRTFMADTSLVPENGGRGRAPLVELLPSGELGAGLTAAGPGATGHSHSLDPTPRRQPGLLLARLPPRRAAAVVRQRSGQRGRGLR